MKKRAGAGFTLLELMTVLGIIAILMGMGIGVLSRLNFAKYGAAGTVARLIRTARESAVASGLPVTVVCDAGENRLYDLSVRTVGLWHFEEADGDATRGAFQLDARLNGARLESPGRIGAALSCGAPGDHAEVSLGEHPSWGLTSGLSVEADVEPAREHTATVAMRGKQFRLVVTADGAVEARVALAAGPLERDAAAGEAIAKTPPGLVPPGRWTRVGFIYDRLALTVLVDGLPRATRAAGEHVKRDASPLVISSRTETFLGKIDELKVGAVSSGAGEPLPKDVALALPFPRVALRFTGEGMLDPVYHRGAVTVGLRFPDGAKRDVTVGPYGTVR